jgi:hypothetical protein
MDACEGIPYTLDCIHWVWFLIRSCDTNDRLLFIFAPKLTGNQHRDVYKAQKVTIICFWDLFNACPGPRIWKKTELKSLVFLVVYLKKLREILKDSVMDALPRLFWMWETFIRVPLSKLTYLACVTNGSHRNILWHLFEGHTNVMFGWVSINISRICWHKGPQNLIIQTCHAFTNLTHSLDYEMQIRSSPDIMFWRERIWNPLSISY